MEAKQNQCRFLFNTFHILHVCFSIGLVIAVVRNQLVNESRFEKLERNLDSCKCDSQKDEAMKTYDSISTKNINQSKYKSDSTVHSLAKRTVLSEFDRGEDLYNYTSTSRPTHINQSNEYTRKLKEDLMSTKTTIATTVGTNTEEKNLANQQSQQTNSTETEMLTKILGKEKIDLLSCLDKLKVIFENQVTADKTDKKMANGCKLLQGPKGDIGEKGERGEKGAMGAKGCSTATVFAPPVFYSSPRSLVFNEGDPAVLSCNATANPSAEITWYRDSIMLVGERDNASYRYIIENRDVKSKMSFLRSQVCPSEIPHPVTQSTLIIKQSRGSDTGTYVCKARNMMSVATNEIRVLIKVFVRCTAIPSSIAVVQGEDVQLHCRASGVPPPVITWYRKDGGPMPFKYNITGGDLHIYKISKEEEGILVCLATNVLGSKTTEAAITVNVFPKITSFKFNPITVNESQTLVLFCNATGYPTPTVRWSKNNGSIPEGRYVYNSHMLNISRVKYEDRGEYVCTANNTVGKAVNRTTIFVQVGPKITKRPNAIEYSYRGKSKTLWLEVFSLPSSRVIWTKPNNGILTGRFRQQNGSLFIENIKYTDSGLYQATASNILGEVKVTTFLVVRDAVPAAIRSIQLPATLSIIKGRNLTETCQAVGVPTPKITWRHPGNMTISATNLSLPLNIVNIGSNHTGRYTCTAKNEFGFDESYFDLKIIQRWVNVQKSYSDYYSYRYKTKNRSSGVLKSRYYSGRRNYPNNFHQYWKFTSNTKIGIFFKVFSTEACCDKVRIYDGISSSSPLIGEFSGDTLPPNVASSSTKLYMTFTTDDSKPSTGFLAIYKSID